MLLCVLTLNYLCQKGKQTNKYSNRRVHTGHKRPSVLECFSLHTGLLLYSNIRTFHTNNVEVQIQAVSASIDYSQTMSSNICTFVSTILECQLYISTCPCVIEYRCSGSTFCLIFKWPMECEKTFNTIYFQSCHFWMTLTKFDSMSHVDYSDAVLALGFLVSVIKYTKHFNC